MPKGLLNVAGEYAFDSQIAAWADQYGIPFALAKGLVSVESRFDPNAKRDEPAIKDASRGLTQILYETAKEIGFSGNPDDLFTPDVNLRYGLGYLSKLLQRSSYSVTDAIAAYNMGSARPASQTTPTIIGIYGQPKPDWMYANEPYVRRVLMNAAFYLAEQQGRDDVVAQIRDMVKKKRLPIPVQTWSWALASTSGRRVINSAAFDWLAMNHLWPMPPSSPGATG